MNDLIDLQNCHATQITHDGVKGEWRVRKNITSEDLYTLPGTISDADLQSCLDFARKFERIAFNAGIEFQKKLSLAMYGTQADELLEKNRLATEENMRLASKLQSLIGEKE